LLLNACGGADGSGGGDDDGEAASCGDGKVNGSEACDGGDLGGLTCAALGGFAEGGALSCLGDCTLDTSACIPLDADGDGVDITTEQQIGTDPNNPDSDTDGFFDGHELEAGSDPLTLASWPYLSGLWPNRFAFAQADGLEGEGWLPGQRVPNHMVTDQFGNPVQLHQFYGYKIVISFGAVWCGPCNQAAASSEGLWTELKEGGTVLLEVLVDTDTPGVPATQNDVVNWSGKYGLTYPVTYGPSAPGTTAVPTYFFINSDLTVSQRVEGFPGDETIVYSHGFLY
jgi:hypothetical protein